MSQLTCPSKELDGIPRRSPARCVLERQQLQQSAQVPLSGVTWTPEGLQMYMFQSMSATQRVARAFSDPSQNLVVRCRMPAHRIQPLQQHATRYHYPAALQYGIAAQRTLLPSRLTRLAHKDNRGHRWRMPAWPSRPGVHERLLDTCHCMHQHSGAYERGQNLSRCCVQTRTWQHG
jgi:hypothetical protein